MSIPSSKSPAVAESPLVRLERISKSYGGVRALVDVDLTIAAGEVHGLCGENGAGKSTLIKLLGGTLRPDGGTMAVDQRTLAGGSVVAAEAAGISVIHQEAVAFPHLNTYDNLFVGHEPKWLGGCLLDRRAIRRQTEELLGRLGQRIDPRVPVGRLPLAARQMVAIARAIARRCRLLIMDEPTASLSHHETVVLLDLIRQLRADGTSVLYVSHRLDEVFEVADRVTVLRDGHWVATEAVSELDRPKLIRLMVGREQRNEPDGGRRDDRIGDVVLEVEGLGRAEAPRDVSFVVRAGEIVALAGLVGAGRSETARTIFGIDRAERGGVRVAGRTLPTGSVAAAVRQGLAMVPEDRQHAGLVLPMAIGANLCMPRWVELSRWGLNDWRRQRREVDDLIAQLAIKVADPAAPAATLSGGNQQKVVVTKWLATSPRILILDEPTRGIDVGAKAEIYRLIRRLAEQGIAVLLISSELPEVLLLSDRILVMRDGRIAGELSRDEADEERILQLALPDSNQQRGGPTTARRGSETEHERPGSP